jgi:hypothetical protein
MRTRKAFDCVEMKNRIQAQLIKKWEGKTDAEIRREVYSELQGSKSPVAEFWRKAQKKKATEKFADVN